LLIELENKDAKMGVPKFYRWISERYPCLSEVIKDYQMPEFDNLYLDMNGIIHVCSHPDDNNPHFRITEEKIFADISHYIEVLFRMIKPKKVFFMAVDGVAPRAKMNQQRSRRFRSGREAEDLVRKALEKGEILPQEERFDSNCITPGTPFMVRLQEQLKYFVVKKVTHDRLWQGVRIYLSGHQTPGEGEHKIMDFIRTERAKPDHDPNTRHCLYGLDADLIMLGLVSHEPHFSLLREEVRFGGKKDNQKRSNAAEETTFHLLHLSLMREYLDFEFSPIKDKLSFPYDIERIIDDWIMMGFLVGNDFIPHLPHVHIHQECLPLLWRTYMEILPTLDGYINEGGQLNLPRFEKYITKLSQRDIDSFSEQYADLKYFAGKRCKDPFVPSKQKQKQLQKLSGRAGIPTANEYVTLMHVDEDNKPLQDDVEEIEEEEEEEEFEEEEDSLDEDDEEAMFYSEFRQHKAAYYMEKLNFPQVTKEVLRDQAITYVTAIQWILGYYYNGCPSWSWYYPHHYAPYMSDVKDFSDLKIEFELSKPFLPFQQLMAVLPPASKNLLPKPLQNLMLEDSSPVKDFYPLEFETDLNGKLQEWEAVVLIPFIDESRLLEAMEPVVQNKLTLDERARNCYGPHLLYEYIPEAQGTYPSSLPDAFPDIVNHHAKLTEIPKEAFVIPVSKVKKGLFEGVRLDVYFPGFPTLKHLPHSAQLKKASVKVFQQNSRGENMVLKLLQETDVDAEQVAQEYIGHSVYVGWPHLTEALVIDVETSDEMRYNLEGGRNAAIQSARGKARPRVVSDVMDKSDVTKWRGEVRCFKEWYMERKGVDVGDTYILLHTLPLSGRKYICDNSGCITLEKQWQDFPIPYVYQGTVKDISVHDPTFKQYKTLDQMYTPDSEVFMLGSPNYGSMGKVLDLDPKNAGRIRVNFAIPIEPDFEYVKNKQAMYATQYHFGYRAAQRLGIDGFLLSRITGTLFVTKGSKDLPSKNRVNIGLDLKLNKSNMEVPGYSKKSEEGQWMYSDKTVKLIADYIREFPFFFQYLAIHLRDETLYEADIFPDSDEEDSKSLQDVITFVKELPSSLAQKMPIGTEFLDDLVVQQIEKAVDKVKETNRKKKKHVKMQVRPHLLYMPLDAQATLVPDPYSQYELYDRVVNVRDGYSVPLGLRGTVTAIHPAEKIQDVIYDVVFDEEFIGGLTLRCSPGRAYRMPPYALINISYGERKDSKGHVPKPMAVVKPQTSQEEKNKQAGTYAQLVADGGKSSARGQARVHNQNQRHHGHQTYTQAHSQPQAQPESSSREMFANIWSDLQGSAQHDSHRNRSNRGDQNQNRQQRQQHRNEPQRQVSLEAAAKTLPSHVQTAWQNPTDKNPQPSTSQKDSNQSNNAKVSQLLNRDAAAVGMTTAQESSDEFARLMQSLEQASIHSQGQQEDIDAQKGTEALCQLLNIGKNSQDTATGGAIEKKSKEPESQGKSRRVRELENWSYIRRFKDPVYDYTRQENRVRAIVTLANGVKYQGSWAKTKEQAAESAASSALLDVSGSSEGQATSVDMGGTSPVKSAGPQGVLTTSPNSAFTPVRPLGRQSQTVPISMPQSQRPGGTNVHHRGGHHGGGAFPAPPPGFRGQGPQFYQQVYYPRPQPHQMGHAQYHDGRPYHLPVQSNYPPQGQHRHQGHHGAYQGGRGHNHGHGRGWAQDAWMQQGQGHGDRGHGWERGQHGDRGQGGWDKGQHAAYPPKEQRQPHEQAQWKRRDHQQSRESWKTSDSSSKPDVVPREEPVHSGAESGTSPGKNPFVPLQVMRQQKTPQKEIKPDKITSCKEDTPPAQQNFQGAKDQLNLTHPQYTASPRTPTDRSKSQTKASSASPPGEHGSSQKKRAKSRLAANFATMD